MTKPMCGAAVGFMLSAGVLGGTPVQRDSVQTGRLNPKIGAAAPQRYKSIRDAKDWENPYLVIRRDGIEVITKETLPVRKTVSAAELQQTLVKLPVTAWPYGRVVAAQDIGIRAADGSDDQSIVNNREATLAILKTLRVMEERWPS